jgi:hypothetical protein
MSSLQHQNNPGVVSVLKLESGERALRSGRFRHFSTFGPEVFTCKELVDALIIIIM